MVRAARTTIGLRAIKRAMPRRRGHSTRTVAGAFGIGAISAFLLSKLDARRRHMAVDRVKATGREAAEEADRTARHAAGKAKGVAHAAAAPMRGDREYDDSTLTRKIETELFRPAGAPKDRVSISVANGVVELRGTLDDAEQANALAKQAAAIEGVRDVRNLLHAHTEAR